MQEFYYSEAIVLDREEANDFDSRYAIYAKPIGKFYTKSKSVRKITSKLVGHLEPGSLVKVRVVGNGGYQLVDALKYGKILISPPDLYSLNQLLPEGDFDFQIWEILTSSKSLIANSGSEDFNWQTVLKILGWDPEEAVCEVCQKKNVSRFFIRNQTFFCEECGAGLTNYILVI